MVLAHESAFAAYSSQPHAMAQGSPDAASGQRHDRILPMPLSMHISTPEPALSDGAPASNGAPTKMVDEVTIGQKMLSAVAGSIATSLLVTPLDVVRVRLQSQQYSTSTTTEAAAAASRSFKNLPQSLGVNACCREVFWINNNAPYCVADSTLFSVGTPNFNPNAAAAAADCAAEETQRRTFNSTFDGLRKIARNEGLTTLWRGLSPTLLMAIPGNVIYFAGYDWLRTSPASPMVGRISEAYSPLIAGSFARLVSAFVVSPIELFRTRMQAGQSRSSSENFSETSRGVQEMVSNRGLRSLWRGMTLTLWRDVPFSALYWWGYEFTRNAITDVREHGPSVLIDRNRDTMQVQGDKDTINSRVSMRSRQTHTTTLLDSFASGAFSGGIASIITTPFDVGKTRQQVLRFSGDSGSSASTSSALEHRSMLRLLWQIFKDEGVPGLFRGCTARILKVAPACAIMISSYEIGKKMAGGSADKDQT